jgi:tRNA A37 methylthiotransferase MiaB
MQSGSSSVLARMKRKYNRDQALAGIERLRAAFPDLMLTTDIIVGFPGESEEEFADTMDFVRRARFLMVHIFPYSPRAGTPASTMPDQIPPQVKKERLNRLEALAAHIRKELLQKVIQQGKSLPVLFETWENGIATGHTANFIEVRMPSPCPLTAQTVLVLPTDLTPDATALIGNRAL